MSTVTSGMVFDVQPFSLHDGPGIRTTVFLKGCPLRCVWCHNPESWTREALISWDPGRCTGCGACVAACPRHAHAVLDGNHVYERGLCDACGRCADACPALALERSGREMTVEGVMAQVLADKAFFAETGGGLTVSGGEPLAQADFTVALLEAGRAAGIHTAVETSGAGRPEDAERIARLADLVLFDLKAAQDDHHRLTGAPYAAVAANLRLIHARGGRLWLRLPLVPGMNDTDAHFQNAARLALETGAARVEILPYHALGVEKRARFGLPGTAMPAMPSADEAQAVRWIERLHQFGVEAHRPGED